MRKKGIDPNIDTMLLHAMSPVECPDMILYEDVYFTKDTFAKQVYLGANGVFLIIPLVTDELEADGEERSFYMHDMEHLVELKEPEVFLTDLYHYTLIPGVPLREAVPEPPFLRGFSLRPHFKSEGGCDGIGI